MTTTPPFALEVRGSVRLRNNNQEGPFYSDPFTVDMQFKEHLVDVLTLPAGTLRKQLAMTVDANFIYLHSDKPVTVCYGTSIEGHLTDLFMVHGHFPQGITVSAGFLTNIKIVVAREAT